MGPPPLEQMTKRFMEMNSYDIATRIKDEGRIPLQPLVHVHELRKGGVVLQDENVRVRATLVDHPGRSGVRISIRRGGSVGSSFPVIPGHLTT